MKIRTQRLLLVGAFLLIAAIAGSVVHRKSEQWKRWQPLTPMPGIGIAYNTWARDGSCFVQGGPYQYWRIRPSARFPEFLSGMEKTLSQIFGEYSRNSRNISATFSPDGTLALADTRSDKSHRFLLLDCQGGKQQFSNEIDGYWKAYWLEDSSGWVTIPFKKYKSEFIVWNRHGSNRTSVTLNTPLTGEVLGVSSNKLLIAQEVPTGSRTLDILDIDLTSGATRTNSFRIPILSKGKLQFVTLGQDRHSLALEVVTDASFPSGIEFQREFPWVSLERRYMTEILTVDWSGKLEHRGSVPFSAYGPGSLRSVPGGRRLSVICENRNLVIP